MKSAPKLARRKPRKPEHQGAINRKGVTKGVTPALHVRRVFCIVLFFLFVAVVYDVELTDVFFRFLYSILIRPPAKTAYLTVEKR